MKNNKEPKNNLSPESEPHYLPIYMCIGLSIGMALGAAVGKMSLGMCTGLSIGVGIGALLDAKTRKEHNDASPSDEQVTEDMEENNENEETE